MTDKLKVGILGTGNIGTDLMIKVLRSELLECKIFSGRNYSSQGMKKVINLGVKVSDQGIKSVIECANDLDLVFDATSAASHKKHAAIFKEHGLVAVDMTPSQMGEICVPAINMSDCLQSLNINMITCGGQASIPIAYVLKKSIPEIEYIEVVSVVSSRSAGPGTRANIDEYIENTEKGIRDLAGCENVKAILNLNPALPCIDMQTTIFAKVDKCDVGVLKKPILDMVNKIKAYVPGYEIAVPPFFENGRIMVMVRVKGAGDYLPSYAGNLDIINCAAINMAEEYAKLKGLK